MSGRPPAPSAAGPGRRLRRDAAYVAAAQLAAVASGLLIVVVGARLLSPQEFGALSWALAWLTYLAVLGQFGLTQVATITLAGSGPDGGGGHDGAPDGDGRDDGAAQQLRRLLVALGPPLVAVALLWWLAVGPAAAAAGAPPEVYRPLVVLVAVWLPAAVVGPVVVTALRARGRFGLSLLFGEHVRRVLLTAALGLAAVVATGTVSTTALWWTVVAESLVYAAGVLVLIRVVAAGAGSRGARAGSGATAAADSRGGRSSRQLLAFGAGFAVSTLAAATVPQAGVWVLAAFAPVEEVAVFAVAVRVALLLATPTAIGMRTLAPRVARAAAAGTLAGLQQPVRAVAGWTSLTTAGAALVLAATGTVLLPAVFGSAYRDAYAPALVLAAGVVVNAWTGPCSVVLSHSGHERPVAVSALAASVGFFLLAAWWAPIWGGAGVAAAATVAMSARNLHLARVVERRVGLRTIAVPSRRGRRDAR